MVWLRTTDTFAFHPIVVAVIEHPDADERTANEVAGFMMRLATLAAQHETDYVASYSTAITVAGTRAEADRLLGLAQFAGWGSVQVDADGRKSFHMVDDAEFLHMKTAEEIAFEKQRKNDNSDPHITVLVRLRDGDACRYCGRVVRFVGARRGKLAGTYDHRPPGRPATADTAVVACAGCNSGRGAISRQEASPDAGLVAADERYPLLSAPTEPYYSGATRTWLNSHVKLLAQYGLKPPEHHSGGEDLKTGSPAPGFEVSPIYRSDDLPDPQVSDTAPASAGVRPDSPAPSAADTAPIYRSVRPAASTGESGEDTAPASAGVRPEPADEELEEPPPDLADPAGSSRFQQVGCVPDLDLPGRVGSGRVGSVRDGSGLAGSPASMGGGRKRRRRGKRTRKPHHPPGGAHENNSSRGPDNG